MLDEKKKVAPAPEKKKLLQSVLRKEYIIMRKRRRQKAVQHVVEHESLGNAVFTMAVLSFFHDHPKKSFPKQFSLTNDHWSMLSSNTSKRSHTGLTLSGV
jgi:uncharacterized protein YnzC (UPF0291/DUF896 family)